MVTVLFARRDSVYKTIPGCDVWDEERDARAFVGGSSVIAHPPCALWGGLRSMAIPRVGEKELALFAVQKVRECGGVLEHPLRSSLWQAAGLPLPGSFDRFGGFTFPILQQWFGHRAFKPTWLYIVGVRPGSLPVVPFVLGEPQRSVEMMGKAERERTPFLLAQWLFELASSVKGVPAW